MSLNEKQQRFVEEYLVDLNGTQAAIRAGYSKKTAGQQAFELLKKPEIQHAISQAQAERSERTRVKQDDVIREIARLAFSDLRKTMAEDGSLLDPHEWDDDTAAAISSVEIVTTHNGDADAQGRKGPEHTKKIKVWDKNSALDKLARHLGMYAPEKLDLNHGGKVTIESVAVEFINAPED